MLKNKVLLMTVSILVLAFASTAVAQPGPIGENILVKPKPGQEAQWEAAYKEHLKWHEERNDSWNWVTYQFMSGPNAGNFMVRAGGHEWSDWDELGEMQAQDTANYYETAGKYAESHYIWYDRIHRDISNMPEGGGPYNVLDFTRIEVKPAMVPQFLNVLGKYHAAVAKTNAPMHFAIAQTETGGATSDFMIVGLHKGFAGLEQSPDAIPKMMNEVYGAVDTQAIFDDFWSCVENVESEIAIRREDLTYMAPESTSND